MHPKPELFWTAPRLASADFLPEDPLAIDYLHQQIGNMLWPGFTTRTGRAGYYMMVCYGLYVADELAGVLGLPRTDKTIRRQFEQWEKLWALAVCHYHGGTIAPVDSVRGQRGVHRAYQDSTGKLSLRYQLLSRQLELGALGAYLTSLREHGLVAKDRLRPTPLGVKLATWMWHDPDEDDGSSHAFVINALSSEGDSVPDPFGRTTLRKLGQRARLSRIRSRPNLQELLRNLLFTGHPPPASLTHTAETVEHYRTTREASIEDPRSFLVWLAAAEQRTSVAPHIASVARNALAFGDLSESLRAAFDRAYGYLLDQGMRAWWPDLAAAAFPPDRLVELQARIASWQSLPDARPRLTKIPMHGTNLVRALDRLADCDQVEALEAMERFHYRVQRDRGKSSGWFRRDGDYGLLGLGGYHPALADMPRWVVSFKYSTMGSLLTDLGVLA